MARKPRSMIQNANNNTKIRAASKTAYNLLNQFRRHESRSIRRDTT